jgi:hypothetical protein
MTWCSRNDVDFAGFHDQREDLKGSAWLCADGLVPVPRL